MTSALLKPASPALLAGARRPAGGYRMPAFRLGTAGRAMTRELLWFVALGIVALSVPIIIISLSVHLPSFALPLGRFANMVYAISCMILVHTIPEITAVVIVGCYARFLSEGVVSTLFCAGRSTLGVMYPACVVAACATLLVSALSTVAAPASAKYIHDTLLFLRRDFNLNMLDTGVFHQFRNENVTIFFKKKIDKTQIGDVFISKKLEQGGAGSKEEIYTARQAFVIGPEGDRALLLVDGNVITTMSGEQTIRKVVFDRAIWRPDTGFAAPSRSMMFFDEMSTPDLLAYRADAESGRRSVRQWLREVTKRLVFPALTFTHTLLGLGLLLSFSPAAGRDRKPYLVAIAVCGVTFALHILFVYLEELIGRIGMPGVALLVGGVLAQAAIGLALLALSERPLLKARLLASLARWRRRPAGRADA